MSYLGSRRHIPVWIGIGKLSFFFYKRCNTIPWEQSYAIKHISKNVYSIDFIYLQCNYFSFLFLVGVYVNEFKQKISYLSLKVNFSFDLCLFLFVDWVRLDGWFLNMFLGVGMCFQLFSLCTLYNEENKYFIWFIFDVELYLYRQSIWFLYSYNKENSIQRLYALCFLFPGASIFVLAL